MAEVKGVLVRLRDARDRVWLLALDPGQAVIDDDGIDDAKSLLELFEDAQPLWVQDFRVVVG